MLNDLARENTVLSENGAVIIIVVTLGIMLAFCIGCLIKWHNDKKKLLGKN